MRQVLCPHLTDCGFGEEAIRALVRLKGSPLAVSVRAPGPVARSCRDSVLRRARAGQGADGAAARSGARGVLARTVMARMVMARMVMARAPPTRDDALDALGRELLPAIRSGVEVGSRMLLRDPPEVAAGA